jgi:hypothetical protein
MSTTYQLKGEQRCRNGRKDGELKKVSRRESLSLLTLKMAE